VEAGKIISKTLIYKRIGTRRGRFSGAERNFSADVRGNANPAGVRALAAAKLKVQELFGELLDAAES
jgi:hypothetical protein